MKKEYETTDEFKDDLEKEYTLADIGELFGWFKREEMHGQMMVCPFHKEHTPSCQIGPTWFRCYACGEKGDVYSFGMKMEHVSYPEIINSIATALGCSIKDKLRISKKQEMLNKLKSEWDEYRKDMKTYLNSNKALSDRAAKLFPIECGYNRRLNRIVVPYTGLNGEIYGFTMRALGDEKPKWKHSYLESSLTDNCATLIGVHRLKDKESAIIVEGPGDIAGVLRAGFQNVLGIGGTQNYNKATLNYMVNVMDLKSLTLFFDGDEPGRKATMQNSKFTISNYYFLAEASYVCECAEDKDPGDIAPEDIKLIESKKVPMIRWFLDNISKQELIYFFKNSVGKMVRKDIVNYLMDRYKVPESECMNALMSSDEDYAENEKAMLKSSAGADEFIKSDAYKNMSPAKAKSILKRKYGIDV